MKKIILPLILLLLLSQGIFAQKEYYNWYFGYRLGLDFNPDGENPKKLNNGGMHALEGCSTISDSDGNLLFYSNGESVWNKEHQIMDNGDNLGGHYSSTQACLIAKQPGNNKLYYIFTTGGYENLSMKLHYSIVDMDKNNGLGSVISKKNLLYESTTEKLAGIRHRNGNDIWIIARELGVNNFKVYFLDSTGLSYSHDNQAGIQINKIDNGSLEGYMKFSHDAKMLAMTNRIIGCLEIFSFNNENGMIEDSLQICGPELGSGLYGLEFSFDCSKLYVSSFCYDEEIDDEGKLYQINLNAGSPDEIRQSVIVLYPNNNNDLKMAALQMGPDKKIYMAEHGNYNISVIDKPNNSSYLCDFRLRDIKMENTGNPFYGLPNFVQEGEYQHLLLEAGDVCEGDIIYLSAELSNTYKGDYSWTGPNGYTSEEQYPVIVNATTDLEGYYYVQANYKNNTFLDSIYVKVDGYYVDIQGDNELCDGGSANLEIETNTEYYECIWSTGETTKSIEIDSPGVYSVWVINSNNCEQTDTFEITKAPPPDVAITGDLALCEGVSGILYTDKTFSEYLWSTGETTSVIETNSPGEYYVEIKDSNGCIGYDTVEVKSILEWGIEIEAEIAQFDTIYVGSQQTLDLRIKNIGLYEVSINIDISSNNNIFGFDTDTYEFNLDIDEETFLPLTFRPDDLIDFYDTLIIEVLQPCPKTYKLPVTGSGKVKMLARLPNLTFKINDYVCIPVYASLINAEGLSSDAAFNAGVLIDAELMDTEQSGVIIGNTRHCTYNNENAVITDEESIVAEICGNVMLGSKDVSTLEFSGFDWLDSHVEETFENGSVTLEGLCIRNYKRLDITEPTTLNISPNPVNEYINITVNSDENGLFQLTLYNIQGREITHWEWKSSGPFAKEINFNCGNLISGVYIIELKSPWNKKFDRIIIGK